MPELNIVLDVLVTIISTFAGAWAAFRFESRRRTAEEDSRRIGAANRAIYVIYHYWTLLEQFRVDVMEPHRARPDAWLNLPAHLVAPTATDRLQTSDLQFLLHVGQAETYATLMLEEQRVMLALNLIADRSRLVLSEAFPRLAGAALCIGQPSTADQIERALGSDVTRRLKEITNAIFKNVDEDITTLRAAHDKMRSTMNFLYPGREFLQVKFESRSDTA